jgi:gag-polypeptide of LTR copia-type
MTTNDKLTSVLLNGNNYQVWVRQANFGLISRDKLDHVTGDKKRPIPAGAAATDAEKASIKRWDRDDTLVIGWLLASMETQISDLMTYQNTSQQIWDKAAALTEMSLFLSPVTWSSLSRLIRPKVACRTQTW